MDVKKQKFYQGHSLYNTQFSAYNQIFQSLNIIQYMNSDPMSKQQSQIIVLNQNSHRNSKTSKGKKSSEVTKGRWSKVQQLKYFLFLFHHRKEFSEDQIRRSQRMCKRMSIYLKTRNSIQCRLHHKRTTDKYGNVDQSIQSYIESCPSFFDKYEKIKNYFQVLEDRAFCGDSQYYDEASKQNHNQKQMLNISQQTVSVEKLQNQIQPKPVILALPQMQNQMVLRQQNLWNNVFGFPLIWQPFILTQSLIYQV